MAEAKFPRNEEKRLRALRSYDLLDRDVDPVFDNIIRIAADVCDVDISVIALIDHDRQFFLARHNMKPRETSRVIAFCAHAILKPHTTFEIENATKDPRFKDNPLVTGEIGVRFYAAHPLTTQEGYALGGLCLIGKKPKKLNEFQRNTIRNLANIIMTLFDARKKEMEVTNQRKKTEEALRESENLLNSIFENVPVGLLIKDPDHIVERANDTYLRWYGFDTDTMVDRRSDEIADFQSAEEAAVMNAQEREVLTTGRTQMRQVDRSFADGQIHTINITKFPVYDQQGNITKVGSVSVDLTDQVEAQKVANAALQEAETANRAKSEFLATMSHELRTPLNAILGFADIINHQYFGPTSEKYKEYAEDIQSSGKHLLSLINEILDLSTIEAGKQPLVKEKLSTQEIVGECKRIIEDRVRSNGIDLVVKVPKGLPPLYADRRAAKQILLNLLSNAVKFTSEGGKITVSAKASKRNTTLKIADTGKGIPAEKLPKLTDPFTKAGLDPYLTEPGWGLGLAITKSLVDLHDGTLDIKSKVGKGTTVTVTLPNEAP